MEQLNTQPLSETQMELPNVTIEEVSEQILNVLASFVNQGPNGEAPRYDLDKFPPTLLFVGAINGVCEAFSQLHSTEEMRVDYVTALTTLQDVFIRYMIDRNIEHVLEAQASSDQTEELTAPVQMHDPSC